MTRRRRSIVAVVSALSLFVALIAGSSLRPQFAAGTLPEPAAWTQQTQSAQTQAGHARADAAQTISRADHGPATGSTSTDKKPFHSMWMTRDRPISWPPMTHQGGWLALPTSFAAAEPPPVRVAPAAVPDHRDNSTRLCVIRC
ncbi:hypothetical protein A5713_19295 [Mycobacterium sp. E2497]|nr:hypothetical protein A5713_19295 [Mycobacterium sp. E2497]